MYRYENTRHGYFQLGKARSSITATNKQLHDYDAENCQLKTRLAECEAEVAASSQQQYTTPVLGYPEDPYLAESEESSDNSDMIIEGNGNSLTDD